jgi:sec-independent protein translocase protein TatA
MLSNLTGWHFVIILFVVLLLFGAPKLPALARSLGQSMKILKTEMAPGGTDTAAGATTGPAATAEHPAAATVAAPAPYVAPAPAAPAAAAPVPPAADRTV